MALARGGGFRGRFAFSAMVHAPLVTPEVVLALSLDDLVIASFASGRGATTCPMRLYSQIRLWVNPEIMAVAVAYLLQARQPAGRRPANAARR